MNNNPWQDLIKSVLQRFENQGRGSQEPDPASGSDEEPAKRGRKKEGKPPRVFTLRRKVTLAVLALLALAFLYWLFHPALNIHSSDLCMVLCVIMLFLFLKLRKDAHTYKREAETDVGSQGKAKRYRALSRIPLAIILLGCIAAFVSATFFPGSAHRYANLLRATETSYTEDIQQVDYTTIPVIDRDSAILLGNRTMGTMADYVSQFEINPLYSQIALRGRPVRVSPLDYADIFKWLHNRSAGLPAYVVVDMATQDTQVVRLEDGMHYSQSEPFFRNIDRHIQLTHPTYMFDQLSFELDEDGHPWWVCPVQKRTIGLFGGITIDKVVLCDACTGECTTYAVGEIPGWVDRAFPADLLMQQYNYNGRFNHGWWNSWFGQQGVFKTTPGNSGMLGYNYLVKDNDIWVYSGVTSATSDNSIIGFVLMNQRTAEANFYPVAGATEASAMASAEGQVQNLAYTATFPLLLNINGQPTYFMALKDNAGLVKKYAMIDIQRYQNVAIGDTVNDCEKSYRALLSSAGVSATAQSDAKRTVGKVSHVAQAVIDGNTHYYLTLEGDGHIYDCPLPAFIEVVAVSVGDTVTLEYYEASPISTVSSFERGAVTQAPGTTGDASGASGTPST